MNFRLFSYWWIWRSATDPAAGDPAQRAVAEAAGRVSGADDDCAAVQDAGVVAAQVPVARGLATRRHGRATRHWRYSSGVPLFRQCQVQKVNLLSLSLYYYVT